MTITPWPSERIAELEALWMTDLATAEIGRRMGLTKNAVIGKAHRLGLRPRCIMIEPQPDALEFVALVERIPQTGCRYIAEPEPRLHEGMYCCRPCLMVERHGKPVRLSYCAEHHALTHLRPAPLTAEARHAD